MKLKHSNISKEYNTRPAKSVYMPFPTPPAYLIGAMSVREFTLSKVQEVIDKVQSEIEHELSKGVVVGVWANRRQSANLERLGIRLMTLIEIERWMLEDRYRLYEESGKKVNYDVWLLDNFGIEYDILGFEDPLGSQWEMIGGVEL